MLDDLDLAALRLLAEQGRTSWSELGAALGMTPPAAAERVRKLEQAGVIRGYSARLAPELLDARLAAFIDVTLDHPGSRTEFLRFVAASAQVLECHHTAGDGDYLLKVRCRDTAELEALISERLKGVPGVVRTRTTIVLSTTKESASPPLPDAPKGEPRSAAKQAESPEPRRRGRRPAPTAPPEPASRRVPSARTTRRPRP